MRDEENFEEHGSSGCKLSWTTQGRARLQSSDLDFLGEARAVVPWGVGKSLQPLLPLLEVCPLGARGSCWWLRPDRRELEKATGQESNRTESAFCKSPTLGDAAWLHNSSTGDSVLSRSTWQVGMQRGHRISGLAVRAVHSRAWTLSVWGCGHSELVVQPGPGPGL